MKKKGIKKTIGCVAGVIILLVIAVAAGGYFYISKQYKGNDAWLYVPKNVTTEALQDSLSTSLGKTGNRVHLMWTALDGKISVAHGAYLIKSGDKEIDIARRIARGQQTPVKVTINNVRTMEQLAERVASKMEWEASDFLLACDIVLPEYSFKKETFPAAFFPDTYEFYWSNEPERVVKRLLEYRNNYWTEERREKAKLMGLTPVEVSTVASIVEEETNKRDERPIVARLYLNRLNKGMMLQADPTVKYAVGDFSLRRITRQHLAITSPYNTYKNVGLPPGPIRIVEKATLDAVLNAPKHNYLYMCAKEDFSGRHNFATDLTTHQRNAVKFHAELNRRKIYK